MNRRGFLRAAASVMPAALAPSGLVAAAESVAAAPVALGAGGMIGGSAVGAAGVGAMGIAASMALELLNKDDRAEFSKSRWFHEYRRHRILARKGLVEREPARLIWARFKLRDLRQQRGDRNQLAVPEVSGVQKKRLVRRGRWGARRKRQASLLRAAGFTHWPWGGAL